MSLHLPAILSPPTPCIPVLALTVLSARGVAGVASSLHGSASGFGLRLSLAGSPMHQAVSCSSWFCLWTGSSSPVALPPPLSGDAVSLNVVAGSPVRAVAGHIVDSIWTTILSPDTHFGPTRTRLQRSKQVSRIRKHVRSPRKSAPVRSASGFLPF